ncbi:MAG: cytochrome ubiquinol oxidase subunit I [Bacteroidaceae bacterium]|nr:cytochrome ubiquinol oxidase subunit I [Bacteroidaceae bacterium]
MTNIDLASVDWARAQFALTAIYHWLFVPLTLGLAVIMGIMETIYYRTKKEFWKEAAVFWQRLFGVNFAMGVATGIILEFEFGTNWSNYSWFVGDIFGAPLAVEGIVAFFMESTFVAVMFFGWQKVSRGFHLTATWLSGLGATFSAWWILVANSWMQYPVGCEFNPDTMRNEMTSFLDVALSPFAIDKFCHTVTSSWIVGAVFVVAVSCYFLLKKKHEELAKKSIGIACTVGLVASLLALYTGDESAYKVAQVQPMKLAAMEALYNGGESQGLTLIAAVNPFEQPNYQEEEAAPLKLEVPNVLSVLATRTFDGYVPGINNIINGYTDKKTGKTELPLKEKIEKGKKAITALQTYRKNPEANKHLTAEIADNMPYFGYGFIKSADDIVPYVPICFYAFRVMVGLGTLFMLFFVVLLYFVRKKDIAQFKWLHWAGIAMLPLAYIASESGWIVAEVGRQPWTIQDMLPTWASVSNIAAGEVMTTFFIFLALFTAMLVAEISIMCKQIKNY